MADQNAISAATEHLSGQEGSDQGSHGALAGALLVKPKAIKTTICPSAAVLQGVWNRPGVLMMSCFASKVQPEVSCHFLEAVTLKHCRWNVTDAEVFRKIHVEKHSSYSFITAGI